MARRPPRGIWESQADSLDLLILGERCNCDFHASACGQSIGCEDRALNAQVIAPVQRSGYEQSSF